MGLKINLVVIKPLHTFVLMNIKWSDWWREATNIYAGRFVGDGPFSLLDMKVGKIFYDKSYTPEYYVEYNERKQKLRKEGYGGMNIGDEVEHMTGWKMGKLLDFFESNPCGYDCVCVKTEKGYQMAHHCKKIENGEYSINRRD